MANILISVFYGALLLLPRRKRILICVIGLPWR